jgi:Calcineurin-like phosphoesterase
VLLLALALACRWPSHVFLLRGNHECAAMTRRDGFALECWTRYNADVYAHAVAVFDVMPLAAVVGERTLAVHGGLSPLAGTLDGIARVERPVVVQRGSLVADLLWGDPTIEADVIGAARALERWTAASLLVAHARPDSVTVHSLGADNRADASAARSLAI